MPLTPPKTINTAKEVLAPLEWLSTLLQYPSLSQLPKGKAKNIVLAPGYLADEWSMRPLKIFLQGLNYTVFDWGVGRNNGQVEHDAEKMAKHLQKLQWSHDLTTPFTLIGWSLGGVVAREVARVYPELVEEIITLGTPITGGPKYTVAANRYAKKENLDLDSFEDYVLQRNKMGLTQPVTSIYTKSDGVVAWKASIDVYNEHARNIEVTGTHLSLGVNATVWRLIAKILAETAQQKPKTSKITPP